MGRTIIVILALLLATSFCLAQDAQVSSGGQILQPLGASWTSLESAHACTLNFLPMYPYGKFASQIQCSLENTAHVVILYQRWQTSLWGGTTVGSWGAWGGDSVIAAADTMPGVRMQCLPKHEYTNKIDWTWYYREIIKNNGSNDCYIRYKALVGAQF